MLQYLLLLLHSSCCCHTRAVFHLLLPYDSCRWTTVATWQLQVSCCWCTTAAGELLLMHDSYKRALGSTAGHLRQCSDCRRHNLWHMSLVVQHWSTTKSSIHTVSFGRCRCTFCSYCPPLNSVKIETNCCVLGKEKKISIGSQMYEATFQLYSTCWRWGQLGRLPRARLDAHQTIPGKSIPVTFPYLKVHMHKIL